MSQLSKRDMLKGAALLGLGSALSACQPQARTSTLSENSTAQKNKIADNMSKNFSTDSLSNMAKDAAPISIVERKARIEKVQSLMQEKGVGSLLLEAGSALTYFTGIAWWRSERFTGVIIPAQGDFAIITPSFEGPSIEERITFGSDIRTWHENEDPFALVVDFIKEHGMNNRPLAIEETVRHFIRTGIETVNPNLEIISAQSLTRGVRMFKSPAELALMQTANHITMAAYRHIYPYIDIGMTRHDISDLMNRATRALGGEVKFSLVLIGPSSSYPHGSREEYKVQEGEIILMDCGCSVQGYQSDISRTFVLGEPSETQQKVFDTVRRGQAIALETAIAGTPAGEVDQAVRRFYESQGFGPGYKAPGLTHRLGHGIGMDGHEPINFVGNETTPLAPGMCFSNEPGIYLPGEFGLRLEDCLYITDEAPVLFTPLCESLTNPFNL